LCPELMQPCKDARCRERLLHTMHAFPQKQHMSPGSKLPVDA
jgi:hypothetical protein